MLLLKILGVLAVLLGLVCTVRLQILITRRGRETTVDAAAGWLRFRVYPLRKRPKKEKPEEQPPEEEPEKGRGFRFAPTFSDLQDALRTLPGPLLRSVRRIGKGIRVHPLTIDWVLGGAREPADAAERYGYLCAALWTFMPAAERVVRIPEPSIRLDVDFDAPMDRVRGEAGISARIGTFLAALTGILIPAALWGFRVLRRHRAKRSEKQSDSKIETETTGKDGYLDDGQGNGA